MTDKDIVLGSRYRDRATGFNGTAVGLWLRWEAGAQVSLTRLGQDGKTADQWFDVGRLEACSDSSPGNFT